MKKDLKFEKQEKQFLQDIKDIIDSPDEVKNFIGENYNKYFPMIPDGEHKVRLLNGIYKQYLRSDRMRGQYPITITAGEIKFLQSLPTELIKRLFYSLIVRAKVKPHASGWISLDFDNTIFYALNDNDARKAKIEIYSECTDYGFDTRVSGSTKPVLCFQLPDMGDNEAVFEFTDGEARERFNEVISYVNHSD